MRRTIILVLLAVVLLGACQVPPTAPSTSTPPPPQATPTKPTLPSPSPQVTAPPPTKEGPKVDIFGAMNAEQADCLRRHWDEATFQAITTYQRPPTPEEEEILRKCGLLKGAPPEAGPSPGSGAPPPQPPPDQGKPSGGGNLIDQLGPRGHQIMSATSVDALHWTVAPDVLRDAGSVPDVVTLPNGILHIYFVDGLSPAPGLLQGSPQQGWQPLELSLTDGPSMGIVDPDAMLLPDGRIRLFYLAAMPANPTAPRAVYSAVSEDGIHFTQEEGVRVAVEHITDPSVVVLPDGTWLMALSRGGTTLLARSTDGVTFSLTEVVVNEGGVPELTLLPDGSLRLFVSAPDGIRSLRSTDGGNTWEPEAGLRISAEEGNVAADPGVTRLPDGTWFMVWKRLNPALLNQR